MSLNKIVRIGFLLRVLFQGVYKDYYKGIMGGFCIGALIVTYTILKIPLKGPIRAIIGI